MPEIVLSENATQEELDRALKQFRYKVIRAGIPDELRKRRFYAKPSLAKKLKRQAANQRRAHARRRRQNMQNDW